MLNFISGCFIFQTNVGATLRYLSLNSVRVRAKIKAGWLHTWNVLTEYLE